MIDTIRPIKGSDRQSVVDILNQVIRTRKQIAFFDETTVKERISWFEAHSGPSHPILVAESNGKVVGWISLSPYRPGREALSATVEVSYGVEESMRQKGVGTQMLTEMLSVAKKRQHRVVFAIVFDNNRASCALLKKCGFKKWGHMPKVADLDGDLVGHYYYGINISE